MDCVDNIGNILKEGDEVLIKVPKSDATYRRGIVKGFKDIRNNGYGEILVEYDDGRLYCNKKRWEQHSGEVIFTSKPTKAWRFSKDIIKCKPEYFNI